MGSAVAGTGGVKAMGETMVVMVEEVSEKTSSEVDVWKPCDG